ncbi:hypothetical protein [Psychroflexus sp. ALD_RP9]|uniref:hypothetical protein n=1 Tax=Psychroflexus sp. ALD_RP9 TaxID=2777186 RepID=UPI001A8E6033|nr:hypothetical protein [Psychroflexus sp. ALD_RP9]QSS96692.1 hypothetical protein IMZ30_09585 [Psychroflexus sp. ALD_RP9]
MNRVDKIWTDLKDLTTDAQVLSYWDNRQIRILEILKTADSNFETAINIIHRLAKSLNDREKYSAVYYLYKAGFQPIEKKLNQSDNLNEVKFELGRGLHHNRKYDYSKRLFNELASTDFETSRIDGWWNQTAFASTRDRIWIKTDVLPAIGRFSIMVAYMVIAIKTVEFLISTTIFIILFELYETWWYQYRVTSYLKEYEDLPEISDIKRNIKQKILIELGISLLFYPIYLLKQEWLLPLVFIIAIYFQVFHYGLNLYYLPKLIGELNRKKHDTPTSAIANAG